MPKSWMPRLRLQDRIPIAVGGAHTPWENGVRREPNASQAPFQLFFGGVQANEGIGNLAKSWLDALNGIDLRG